MSHAVSVRDLGGLVTSLKEGRVFPIPEECRSNSRVIRTILQNYAEKVWPEFKNASLQDFLLISNSAAYLMRPDILINAVPDMFPGETPSRLASRFHSTIENEGHTVHIKNDPSVLIPKFRLPISDENRAIAPELFRLYAGTLADVPDEFKKRLGFYLDTYGVCFPLADMTACLLCPTDLNDYDYSEKELNQFKTKVTRQLESQ